MSSVYKDIDRTIEAYRGKPIKEIEQKYKMTKELADLLSMQALVSQKEALTRETMLREEQQAGTLADQYEQKLTADNKNSMAQRIDSVMGLPKNQGQPMPQGQRPPMPQGQRPPMPQGQRPPMPQGQPMPPRMANGGLMRIPRANMRNMAQGGIIGFQAGAAVPSALSVLSAAAPQSTTANTQPPLMTPAQIKAQNAGKLAAASALYGGNGQGPATTTTTTKTVAALGDTLKAMGLDPADIVKGPTREDKNEDGTAVYKPDLVSGKLPTGLKAIQEKKANIDPDKKKKEEVTRLDARYGLEARKTQMAKELADQEAANAARFDPAKLKREKKDAILGGYVAGGVKGSQIAQNRLRSNTEAGRQENLTRMRTLTASQHKERFDQLSLVDTAAAQVWKDYSKQADEAFKALSTLSQADVTALENRYKTDVESDNGRKKNVIAAARAANEQILVEIQRKSASVTEIGNLIKGASESIRKTRDQVFKRLEQVTQVANVILMSEDASAEAKAQAVKDLAAAEVQANKEVSDKGLNKLMTDLSELMTTML